MKFEGKLVGHDLETEFHLDHARHALIEMAKGERVLGDCKVMWY